MIAILALEQTNSPENASLQILLQQRPCLLPSLHNFRASLVMASSKVVLFSVTALVVFATVTMAETTSPICEPGEAFSHEPLEACRAYVLRRCAGDDPPDVRARCCHQLGEVTPPCRCEAVQFMFDILLEDEVAPPSCSKGRIANIAAALPAQCYGRKTARCKIIIVN